jgi:murein DD-endopeptidase MepM/ murein hydrolase activator NlpD
MRQLRALIVIGAVVLAGQAAAKSGPPTTYKAKRGDTLGSIARRFHTTVDALAAANDIPNPNRIRVGQVLNLKPKPAMKPIVATKPAKPAKAPLSAAVVVLGANGTSTYKVAKGDNLSKIATRYDTTVAELRKLNNLKPKAKLQVGQVLNVPGGVWACPVNGKPRSFSNDWGAARDGARQHMGNDVFAKKGTPVIAPVAGRVEWRSGAVGGIAFYLHGIDGVTYYGAHLDGQVAKAGQVKAGQQIGTVGNTGNAKGGASHLHFEIHPNGVAVNPYWTLKRWC